MVWGKIGSPELISSRLEGGKKSLPSQHRGNPCGQKDGGDYRLRSPAGGISGKPGEDEDACRKEERMDQKSGNRGEEGYRTRVGGICEA